METIRASDLVPPLERHQSRQPRLRAIAASLLAAGLASPLALAAPQDGQVVAGQAQILTGKDNASGGHLTYIDQKSERAAIDWRSFSIDRGERVHFNQPNVTSSTLNRVTGDQASAILGTLSAKGQVILVNPNGIVFGKGARVDVGGLIASTSNIGNADFLEGKLIFDAPGKPGAGIIQSGTVTAAEGGLVALVAPHVRNDGLIQAKLGKVVLGAGDTFTIDLFGDQLVSLALSDAHVGRLVDAEGKPVSALINQAGDIDVQGGKAVLLTAGTAKAVVDGVINISGVVRADSATVDGNGHIVLARSAGDLDRTGNISIDGKGGATAISGQLLARGSQAGQPGGRIEVSADTLRLEDTASFDASSEFGGGELLLKGMGRVGQVEADVLSRALRTGTDTLLESAAGADIDIDARIDGRSGKPGGGLEIRADRGINLRQDLLTENGALVLTAANSGIAVIPRSAAIDGTRTEPLLYAGSAGVDLTAKGDVSVYDLITSGDVTVTSTAGNVSLLSQLGYFPNTRLNSLVVRAESDDASKPGDVFARDVKVREGGKIEVKAFRNVQVVFGEPDETGSLGMYEAETSDPQAISLQSALMGDLWRSRTWQRAPNLAYTAPGADGDWRTFRDNPSTNEPPGLLPPGPTNRLPPAAELAQIVPPPTRDVFPAAVASAPQSPASQPAAQPTSSSGAPSSNVAPAGENSASSGAAPSAVPQAVVSPARPEPVSVADVPVAANDRTQAAAPAQAAIPPQAFASPVSDPTPARDVTTVAQVPGTEQAATAEVFIGTPLPRAEAMATDRSGGDAKLQTPRLLRASLTATEDATETESPQSAEVISGGRGVAQVADLGRSRLTDGTANPFERRDHVVEAPACDVAGGGHGYFATDTFGQSAGGGCQ